MRLHPPTVHRTTIRGAAFVFVAVGGCATPTGALLDLPELRVVTPPASEGSPVVLEVVNTTPFIVSFEALACAVHLEELVGSSWQPVPPPGGDCIGLPVELSPDARHGVSIDTPPDRGGRFRARVEGSSPEGQFVIRSQPFDVE
jgi:hypothetical protein